MLRWNDVQYTAELRKDARRTADRERLISQITGGASWAKRYKCWLARLGARLVTWGSHLQERYADALAVPQAAHAQR